MTALPRSVAVDVVSDVVCPWCFIGQKRLDRAIASLDGIDVVVNWRPFQLDPSIPAGGVERKQYMRAKFGDDGRLRDIHARLERLGDEEGIAFDFDAITVSPNTLDAHRMIRWAASDAAIQGSLVRELFRLYFEQGENVGDHHVLVEAARRAGMDLPVVEALLPTDADREAVLSEVATASRMGVTGVPCFLLERKYAVMGAQPVATLANAISQVAEAKARGEPDAQSGQPR